MLVSEFDGNRGNKSNFCFKLQVLFLYTQIVIKNSEKYYGNKLIIIFIVSNLIPFQLKFNKIEEKIFLR